MKYLFSLALTLLFSLNSLAQIYNPVKWSVSYAPIDETTVSVSFTAKIDEGWHLYSQTLPSDEGPIATEFFFDKSDEWEAIGKVEEVGKLKVEYDPNFEMDLNYYETKVTFVQKVRLLKPNAVLKGYLDFMVCDAEKCLPPESFDFDVKLSGTAKKENKPAENTKNEESESTEELEVTTEITSALNSEASNEIPEHISWEFKSEEVSPGQYAVLIKATLEAGWHIYSCYMPDGDGPIKTTLTFDSLGNFTALNKVEEIGKLKKEFDPNFDMDVSYFEKTVTLKQLVNTSLEDTEISGRLDFMICDNEGCIFPEPVFFKINTSTGNGMQYFPDADLQTTESSSNDRSLSRLSIDLDNPLSDCGEAPTNEKDKSSLWNIFLLGFFGGLLALITPCVFPMIPLTVSFFTKGSENKRKGLIKAFSYGFFILLIYLLLSLPFHLMDQLDPGILHSISTNPWLNVAFFAIFIFFAFSFFGYFELTLPSKFTNKVDRASDVGGLIGTFFMALTLAIVSFSCTGPILGSLLAGSLTADGGAMQLTAGMGGFGFALALPFALFAAFPGMLNSLPKSGGWLNSVKVVLGFIEVALAIKFLSNADLVEHWGILKIEPFLVFWIIISLLTALYLFGKIKFPHDSPNAKISPMRMGLGVLFVVFALYLGSGFRYNEETKTFTSLSLLSGLAPPVGYSIIYPKSCPLNLDCEHDYFVALERAKREGKPLMVDFTGHACVNCRKMEENVWNQNGVFELISDEYVLVSLYVDDRTLLPEEEQFVFEMRNGAKKKIRTVGDVWKTMQIESFNNNSQPWYVLLDNDETLLNNAVGNTPNKAEYQAFLECGLEAYKKRNNK